MIYFIVNEKSSSGNGENVWAEVKTLLANKGIEYRFWTTKKPGHATEIARNICEQNHAEITMVVIGGDGTINEIINGITDFERVRLGIIPTGSGNDFARGLGLLKGSNEQCLNRILENKSDCRIDLGLVKYDGKQKLFAISSGVGMDALVCKKVSVSRMKKVLNKLRLGKFIYLVVTVRSLFSMEYSDLVSVFDGNREMKLKGLIFMASMNFSAEGGGVPMAPRADAKDGKLSACACFNVSKWGALVKLPLLMIKKHEKLKSFRTFEYEKGELRLSKPMALHTDGEYLGDVRRVQYECVQGKLRFIM